MGVTEVLLPAPARGRGVRRRVVDPDPPLLRPLRVARELRADLLPGLWAVPPGADGKQRAVDLKAVLVGRHPEMAHLRDPLGELLARGVAGIQIVIP